MLRSAVALILAAPAATQAQRPAPAALAQAVDSLATRIVAAGLTPGLGVAIVMDGKTIFSKGYGFADVTKRIAADERTLWYVASTSKSYTGFGIVLLAQRGELRLDQSIASLLPGTKWYEGVDPSQL